MRIAVIFDEPERVTPQDHWLSRSSGGGTAAAEGFADSCGTSGVEGAARIEAILREGGFETTLFGAREPAALMEFLVREGPELIFNSCEALGGNASLEMNVAAVFEILGIPFTGSSALTLGMALNKSIAKALFVAHGVPTPPWAVLIPDGGMDAAATLRFPLMVKPLNEDASIGIDTHSVVEDTAGLAARVKFIWEEFRQPALVEEFIEGREVNVAVLAEAGGRFVALPVSEIVFQGFPDPKRQIVTYAAKWMLDSPEYSSTVPRCPAELSPQLADEIQGMALRAAGAVQLRDYGRIDFRVRGSDGAIFVLEANPNPDITADSGFARAAGASGRTHAEVIHEIVKRARERAGRRI